MFAPFPEEQALKVCHNMIQELNGGSLELRQISAVSAERGDHGVMIGAAVCQDDSGRLFVLKAVSGISKEFVRCSEQCTKIESELAEAGLGSDWITDGCGNDFLKKEPIEVFVPPVVLPQQVNQALSKNDGIIHELTDRIKFLKESRRRPDGSFFDQGDEEKRLCEKRLGLCNESLQAVYGLYSFNCADGKVRSLMEICESYGRLPPTGTGDCCAPKLLHYAFGNHFVVLSMAEVFFGQSARSKISGKSYGPCDERCALILPAMLGIKIIYRDKDIVVVEKPGGLLSVPGRTEDKQDCVVSRIKRLFPNCIEQPSVHRLDMETSGLLVLAFTKEAHDGLCAQFENKIVQKKYKALLDGDLNDATGISAPNGIGFADFDPVTENPTPLSDKEAACVKNYRFPEPKECQKPWCKIFDDGKSGEMELYFRVDLTNRPKQIWDTCYGKKAVTKWKISGTNVCKMICGKKKMCTPVEFIPITGRTHQLRLASASKFGFGLPIVGDSLYCEGAQGPLMLHSSYLCFVHPVTGVRMEFESDPWWEK